MALIFDTETTDLVNFKKKYDDPSQPYLIQLGMILVDTVEWKERLKLSLLIDIQDSQINSKAQEVHGISKADCQAFGVPLKTAMQIFQDVCAKADCLVAHNLNFDRIVLQTSSHRLNEPQTLLLNKIPQICTMETCTNILQLPGRYRNKYKWPSLEESYQHFAGSSNIIEGAHDALADAEACLTVFRGLVESEVIHVEKRDKSADNQRTANAAVFPTKTSSCSSPQFTQQSTPLQLAKPGELKIVTVGEHFCVEGNTYQYKESLKALGATWDGGRRAWVFKSQSMLQSVRKLAGFL